MSWGHNIRQLFGRKYLTILIAYLRLASLADSECECPLGGKEGIMSIISAKLMSDPGSEARVKLNSDC